MRYQVFVFLVLYASMLLKALAFSATPPETNVVKISKTGAFHSSGDLFYVTSDLIYSFEAAEGKLAEYAFRKMGSGWEKASITGLPALQPVALGACDPLNQVDLSLQHAEFGLLQAVAGHNLKQVIETESYALLFVLGRGSGVGGEQLSVVLAVPKGSGWVQKSVLPVSSSAQFCVAQALKAGDGNQSIFVFYDEVAGSSDSFGVTTFDLTGAEISKSRHSIGRHAETSAQKGEHHRGQP